MNECLLVHLVPESVLWGEQAHLLELHADAFEFRDVVVVVAPQTDPLMFVPDREYGAIDQFNAVFREESPNDMNQQVHPRIVTFLFHVLFNRQCNHPFASLLVMRVFPFGSDAFLKHQVVCV